MPDRVITPQQYVALVPTGQEGPEEIIGQVKLTESDRKIGKVDLTSVIPGTAATNLGKAEDAVHATGDVGVMILGVRKNTAIALAGTDGDYIPFIFDTIGALHVNLANLIAGEDLTNDVLKVEQRFSFANIVLAAPTTTVVKSGAGFLHGITINKSLANGVITIYDNTAGSGTLIGAITKPAVLLSDTLQTAIYDVSFATGLTIVTSGAAQDITVSYR